MEKSFASRKLNKAEARFSKTLSVPMLRKEFIFRLNKGESLASMEDEFHQRQKEALIAQKEERAQQLRAKEHDKDIETALAAAISSPFDVGLLQKALQVPSDVYIWEKQIQHLCNLFVSCIDDEKLSHMHTLGYQFVDAAADEKGFFNGMTLEFIFMGGYFTSASWVLLTKHHQLIRQLQLNGRAACLLKNMFYTLVRKEALLPPRKEYEAHYADMKKIVNDLFIKSLNQGLCAEEKSILNVYNLLQVFA